MKTKTNKGFDCIALKREAQARIYDQIKDMKPEQEIRYFNERAGKGPLAEWWASVVKKSPLP